MYKRQQKNTLNNVADSLENAAQSAARRVGTKVGEVKDNLKTSPTSPEYQTK